MKNLSQKQIQSRQRTLLATVLLSMWAPLTTGLAVLLSHSTTQLADFFRRTVEFLALLISWLLFRYLIRNPEIQPELQKKLEKTVRLCVAGAMIISGLTMVSLGFIRLETFKPGGNVYPGMAIAFLGLITNSFFWRRYARLNREEHSDIIQAQQNLYRAKSMMDLAVLSALSAVALMPLHPLTPIIDIAGSFLVALYLILSGVHSARKPNMAT